MRWLASLLGRGPRQSPAGDPPGFDAVWQPGEIAECIHDGGWWWWPSNKKMAGPDRGDRCRVVSVENVEHPSCTRHTGLRFAAWPYAFPAFCFRKVVPQADAAEAADRAFLEQLRTLPAPAKLPEPADHG